MRFGDGLRLCDFPRDIPGAFTVPHDAKRSRPVAGLRKWRLPDPASEGSKETRGRVLIIAGAVEMPGAATLASTAALRAGAGKVRVATAEAGAMSVASAVPELFVLSVPQQRGREDALRACVDSAKPRTVLIGPGMRDSEAIASLLPQLLEIDTLGALIINASALRWRRSCCRNSSRRVRT